MTAPAVKDNRIRAYVQFLAALFYYFLARALARHGAMGLSNEQWAPLVEQAMLAFLLLLGYAGLGFSLNQQAHPIAAQGFPARRGWTGEVGLGAAIGWALAVLAAAILALAGGIAVSLSLGLANWGWLLVDLLYFALWTLVEEVAFRGYAFQRFMRATGPAGAVLGFALFYAFLQSMQPGWNRAGIAVSLLFSLVLSIGYLRTRALWVSWGFNFGWKASRALIFGLTVSGVNTHSPVVEGNPMGRFWLTGGGFGLDGSWLAVLLLLVAWPVVYMATRDLDYHYNAPEFIPGGIAVDLDAAARRQHEAAMGEAAAPAAPSLVQIAPLPSAPSAPTPAPAPPNSGNETSSS